MGGTNSCNPLLAAGPGNALKRVTLCPRAFKLLPSATNGTVCDFVPPIVANRILYPVVELQSSKVTKGITTRSIELAIFNFTSIPGVVGFSFFDVSTFSTPSEQFNLLILSAVLWILHRIIVRVPVWRSFRYRKRHHRRGSTIKLFKFLPQTLLSRYFDDLHFIFSVQRSFLDVISLTLQP